MPKIAITDLDGRDVVIDAQEFVLVGYGTPEGEKEPRIFALSHAAPIFVALASKIIDTMALKDIDEIMGMVQLLQSEEAEKEEE